MTSAKILIVDDAQQVRRVLRTALSAEGYTIFEAATGEEALESIRSSSPDAILLDVNMPGIGGLEACREIRRSLDVPILMLTVRNAERDKVMALDAGADDYVVKPFGMQELLARIRVLLNRFGHQRANIVDTRNLCIDLEARLVTVRGKRVNLGPKEFEVLKVLVLARGKPVSHRNLLQVVWGRNINYPELVRVVVHELRRKIELKSSKPKYICTEPHMGYKFILPG